MHKSEERRREYYSERGVPSPAPPIEVLSSSPSTPPMHHLPPPPPLPSHDTPYTYNNPYASLPPPPFSVSTSNSSQAYYPTYSHPPPVNHSRDRGMTIYTEDASTKLSDRVRRRCFNCSSTETSTWRRSTLHPGKVLCNKCGLFERTHSKNRPEQFPHKRGERSAAGPYSNPNGVTQREVVQLPPLNLKEDSSKP